MSVEKTNFPDWSRSSEKVGKKTSWCQKDKENYSKSFLIENT